MFKRIEEVGNVTAKGSFMEYLVDSSLNIDTTLGSSAKIRKVSVESLKSEAREAGRMEGALEGRRKGKEEGFAAGYEMGIAQAQIEMQSEIAALGQECVLVKEWLEKALVQYFESCEDELVTLGMQIAQKIIVAELLLSRESVMAIGRQAVAQVTQSRSAVIKINPFDLPFLSQHKAELMNLSSELKGVEFVPDANILGGCLIETDGGTFDATIGTKLMLVETEIRKAA